MIKTRQTLKFAVLVIMTLSLQAFSQVPSWNWVKWSNGTQTSVKSACADAAGNLYAAGTFNTGTKFDTANLNSTGDAGFVVKYLETGTYAWSRKIKNPGYAAVDCKSVAIDASGNIYITGAFAGTIELDSKTLTGGGHYLAKYDNNGNIQWAVKTSGSNAVAANNNGIYVAGGSIIQKFDASGVAVWTIAGVKNNQGYTNIFSIAINSVGNLIVAGDIDDSWTFGTFTIAGGYQNMILMEVKDAGTISWYKVLGASTNGADHIQHITIDKTDNIIMTGAVGGPTTINTVNIAAKNGYLLKLNSSGIAKWGTAISNINTIYGTGGVFVSADIAGNMYVTGGYGTTDVTDGSTTTYIKAIKNGNNAFVLKFDSTGVFKTALTNLENPIINNSRGMALASSASGLYFAGVCAPNSEWGSLKVTGYGSVFAKIDGSAASKINSPMANNLLNIYPNPNLGIFKMDINSELLDEENISIKIVNQVGETILYQTWKGSANYIDLTTHAKGVYIILVLTNKGTITKKLIIE